MCTVHLNTVFFYCLLLKDSTFTVALLISKQISICLFPTIVFLCVTIYNFVSCPTKHFLLVVHKSLNSNSASGEDIVVTFF